jgi:hypothetical protein
MTSKTMECPEARISLGVYVLGAIDPAERTLVDAHLSTCQDCRDELAGLAGLPALLGRVSKEEAIALADTDGTPYNPYETPVPAPEPPKELLAAVLDLTTARRRRRHWRDATLAVAAAALIAVGVFGGLRLGSSPAQQTATTASAQQGLPVGPVGSAMKTATGNSGTMSATVKYSGMGWGTYLDTSVTGIPVGTDCKLYVIEADGTRVQANNWVTDDLEGHVWYPGSVSMASGGITGFEVTVGSGKTIQLTV